MATKKRKGKSKIALGKLRKNYVLIESTKKKLEKLQNERIKLVNESLDSE